MKDKKMSPEEMLEAARLLERICRIDLSKLEEERFEALRPVEKLVEDLRNDKKLYRGPGKGLGKPKKKVHWKTKRAKWRQYYQTSVKPRRADKLEEQLTTPEGWYAYVTRKWKVRDIPHFSLEEWTETIYPLLGGRVPYFSRYSTKKGFTLENTLVRATGTGEVIFDGKEHVLRKLGYIL